MYLYVKVDYINVVDDKQVYYERGVFFVIRDFNNIVFQRLMIIKLLVYSNVD